MKRRLKPFVVPTIISIFLFCGIVTSFLLIAKSYKSNEDELLNVDFVNNSILENELPVINTNIKVIKPYNDKDVTIGKYFYDYKGNPEQQEKSLIYHEDTYIQNSGIDYVNKNAFDIVAVLDGTVKEVSDNELLGKIVEIEHDNGYMSIYQSLNEVSVKKGDRINQGQIIGKSGSNKLDKDLGNHLHFEFYANGQIVDPILYLDKELVKNQE